jgi:superfamily II DNA or RNA helicase
VWREEEFTVATFQTLVRAVAAKDPRASAFLKSVQGVIIDEVHVAPADTFFQVLMALENAYFRVGMSGTPLDRTDKRSVLTIAATGRIIYTITPDVLIDAGVLARPRIKLMAMPQESELPTWQGVYGECVVRSVVRNRAVVDMVRMAEKPCLVFVKEVTHGKRLNKTLMKAGFNSDFVWGTSSTDARKSDVKRLVRGDIDVLVCSVIFQEGIDIPELRSVVIVSGGKSVIATLQRLGRGMRVVAGKKEFEVWDFDDQGNKWLERHARARRKAYVDQGYETILLPRTSQPPLL